MTSEPVAAEAGRDFIRDIVQADLDAKRLSQIVTRFPAELGARLDRYTERLRNERFGLRVSRAAVLRAVRIAFLAELLTQHRRAVRYPTYRIGRRHLHPVPSGQQC